MWTSSEEICVFLEFPRGLSLQGTIPSLSAMVFSRPGGSFLEAIYWLNDLAPAAAAAAEAAQQQQPK